MTVPSEYQAVFGRWCAERVPTAARGALQVGYRVLGDVVTISERRPPAIPELTSAWTSLAVAQLRYNDPEPGQWRIYRPGEDGWRPYEHPPTTVPEPLLAEIATDPRAVFWS